jgi:hypothetical protein
MRRRSEGLVAGVATAVARSRGWKVRWVRAAFAIPVVGGAAYGVLWIALPAEGVVVRSVGRRVLMGALLGVAALTLVTGAGGWVLAGLVVLLTVATAAVLVLRPLVALAARRSSLRAALARTAAAIGLGAALLAVAVVWVLDDLNPPDVPHLILSDSLQYCASCHGVPGAAQGAPVWPDLIEHSGGESCVSCHSSQPPPSIPEASWWLPLTQQATR